MRVAFLTEVDARDPRAWSGIPYHMLLALAARGFEVVPVGPLMPRERRLAQGIALAAHAVGRRRLHHHTWLTAQGLARVAAPRIAQMRPDVVFAPAAAASIASLETPTPIVYYSDATFRLMVDYYPAFSGLAAGSVQEGDQIEAAALRRASHTVFSSRWAAESATRDYGISPDKVSVVPFGANLDIVPPREEALAERPRDALRMLFLGVSWTRKGGDIAVEALRALRAAGVPATLTVCGCLPPAHVVAPGLEVVPLLDKRRTEDRLRLARLLAGAHVMIMPTRHDCSPVAFSEAAAHGLPVVSTRTGGVGDVVVDGETGILLEPDAAGDAYAQEIAALWDDPARMARMRAAGRARFETRLNWEAWARDVGATLARAARIAPAPTNV